MNGRAFTLLVWLMLLTVLPCGRIDAQPQDRLRSTLDLLKRKLETHLTYSLSEGQGPEAGTARFEAVSFESCRIAWTSSLEVGQHPDIPPPLRNTRMVNHMTVDLSSIDPDKTRIYTIKEMVKRNVPRALMLELKIRLGSRGFRQQLETTAGGRVTRSALEVKSYAFAFDTNDLSIAQEVLKAFTDAINVCRSRHKP